MKITTDRQEKKRKYEKPKLRIIELVAEEVLAVGCKTVSGGGLLPISIPCSGVGCNQIGS